MFTIWKCECGAANRTEIDLPMYATGPNHGAMACPACGVLWTLTLTRTNISLGHTHSVGAEDTP